MKILNLTLFAYIFCVGIISCSHAQKRESAKEFRLPDVPVTLTAPEDRAAYLSLHYWDHFDFADTTLIDRPEITEQALVDFISILPYTEKAQAAVDTLFRRASAERRCCIISFRSPTSISMNLTLPCTMKNCISSFYVP